MRKILTSFVFVLSLSVFFFSAIPLHKAHASHAMAIDITYDCLGNGDYVFETRFYRDCSGVSAPSSMTLNFNSASCGTSFSHTLPKVDSSSAVEVSQLCPSAITNSTCNGGTLPGTEVYTYRDTLTMPDSCSDWVISWSTCCRNDMIDNLQNSSSQSMYFEVTMNNINGLCNSSPNFSTLPTPYICAGQEFCYSHGVIDPDGDSLVYELTNPLNAADDSIPYNPGFSITNPISNTSGFSFNSETGEMCFTPDTPQVGVIAVLVKEYRGDSLIGTTIREMQVVVRQCSNIAPFLSSNGIYNVQGAGVKVDTATAEVCAGDSLSWQVEFSDSNALDSLSITSNINSALSGATFYQAGSNPAVANFTWQPTALDTGDNYYTVQATDDACPVLGTQYYVFNVRVMRSTWAKQDTSYCTGGDSIRLEAFGGSSFSWSPASGLSCTNCKTPMAAPSTTTDYVVTSNLANSCGNKDTITIRVVSNFNVDAGTQDTICKYGSTQLDATVGPVSQGPFQYYWSPSGSVSDPTLEDPVVSPLSTTTYELMVTSDSGCVLTDSVTVHVIGETNKVYVEKDTMICPGDSVQLEARVVAPVCGTTSNPCVSSSNNGVVGDLYNDTYTYGPFYMFTSSAYSVRRQYLFRKSELEAMGFKGGGTITDLAMNVTTVGDPINGLKIKMKCTSKNEFTSTDFETGLTTVRNTAPYTPTTGWNNFNLDNPFQWDGQSNIIIEFCTADTNRGNYSYIEYTRTTDNACNYLYSIVYEEAFNDPNGCTINTGWRTYYRPRMEFTWCNTEDVNNYSWSWSPTTGLSDPTVHDPTSSVNSTTTYNVTATAGDGCESIGNVTISTDTSFTVSTTQDTTLCPGDSIQLNTTVSGSPGLQCNGCGLNSTSCTKPQNTVQLGSGTSSTSSYGPFYQFYEDYRIQYLFRASELEAIMNCGTITGIALNVTTKNSTRSYDDFTIKMGCTSADALSTSGWETTAGTVYGPAKYNSTTGWNTFNFSQPFDWDGVSNVVIEFCYNNKNNQSSSSDYVEYHNVCFDATMREYTDMGNGCSLSPGFAYSYRPNVRFTQCEAPDGSFSYQWSPSSQVSDDTTSDPYGYKSLSGDDTLTVTVSGGTTCPISDNVVLNNCNVLPLELLSFDGYAIDDKVKLQWQTTNEQKLDYFVLQRAPENESTFEPIATVEAKGGEQPTSHTYTYFDAYPTPNDNYYRLKQVDEDGGIDYSKIIHVNLNKSLTFDSEISPNPVQEALSITFNTPQNGRVEMRLYDVVGNMVHQATDHFEQGPHTMVMDLNDLSKGVYFLELNFEGQSQDHHKFFKK